MLILKYLLHRGVVFIVEQPVSSCMFDYPPFARLIARHGLQRVALHMGAFGLEAVKETVLVGNAPYAPRLARSMTPEERSELRAVRARGPLRTTYTYIDAAG
ncbi:MAG: hypothetical protein GY772_18095, partial [bacterium]|nr:hypothetical protein [bacterium]